MKAFTQLTITLICLIQGHALVQDSPSRFLGPGFNSKSPPPLDPKAEELLKQLNLQSSTDPRLAGARTENIPNLLTASAAAVFRAASGVFAQDYQISLVPLDESKYAYVAYDDRQLQETGVYKPPAEPIIIYEFEACPFCRKVREACSMLSLSVTFRPTPKNGKTYRTEIKEKFGDSATFPYMIDPNTGTSMFESNDIIRYLFETYGNGRVPWTLQDNPMVPLSAGLGVGLARLGAGGSYKESNPPSQPLVLWAYEGSPFCKVVREELCAMEIPHTVIFTPRGSQNRQLLWEKAGRFQVPYLEDPNTQVAMFESDAMIEYIQKQYSAQ